MNELNLPFRLESLSWSAYALVNLALAVVATCWLTALFWNHRRAAMRPVFMVALLLSLMFQWPVWVFSGVLERSLTPHWSFALHAHTLIFGLLAWISGTPALTDSIRLVRQDTQNEDLFRNITVLCVLAIGGVLVSIYLQRVGFSCTGLASTVLDPELALLARELSIKMAGGGWPTFAHALLVSVVSPVAVFLALQHAIAAIGHRKLLAVLGNALIILFFLVAVLLPGAKGNLIPTFVASGLGLCFHAQTWLRRVLNVLLVSVIGMSVLVAVEMVKEKRYFQDKSMYPFAQCVKRLDICVPMRDLLNSLSSRDYALGISASTIDLLHSELEEHCRVPLPQRIPFAFELPPVQAKLIDERRRMGNDKVSIDKANQQVELPPGAAVVSPAWAPDPAESPSTKGNKPTQAVKAITTAAVPSVIAPPVPSTHALQSSKQDANMLIPPAKNDRPVVELQRVGETLPMRAWAYAEAISYRAFVVPLQVAAWHYDFVDQIENPGAAVLLTARWTHNQRVTEMPRRIHDHYSPGYSGGTKVATGTAPTNFLVSYAAPLATAGMLLALTCVVVFDALVVWVVGRVHPQLKPLGVALAVVAALNLMLTDFETTMASHGAVASLMLLLGLDFAYRVALRYLGHRCSMTSNIDPVQSVKPHAELQMRLFDVIVALVLLMLLSFPLLLLAAVIRLRLGSPVLFRQVRPGLQGLPFTMVKFRTMTDGRGPDGELLPDAQRSTSFGRFLRSTSLDELPELWNVLRGEMSLVGPRPLLMEYLPLYSAEQARRHEVRPGITGWAQVNGRNAVSWDERFRLDVWYVDHRSLWLDLRILWLTVCKVLVREGINAQGEATMPRFTGNKS